MAKGVSFSTAEFKPQYDPIFKDTEYWDTYQALLKQYADGVPFNWWRSLTGQATTDLYNHKMALSNALVSLAEQKRSDEHNSYSSQVEQIKQAGLNPDLQGVDNAGGSSSASTPNEIPMQYENPIPHIVSFLSMIGGAVAGAQSMVSQRIVNDGMRLQNLDLADNIVLKELGRLNLDPQGADIMPSFKIGFNTGNRSQDKKLESRANALYDSISHRISTKGYERDLASIRKETFDITSSAGYSSDDAFYQGLAVRMADAYQKLIDMQNSTEMKEFQSRSKYLDNLDSGLSATTENESNKRSSNRDKQWNEFISIQHGLIGYIRSEAKKGNSDAIDLLFRIFGENVGTSGTLAPFRETGLSLSNFFNGE